MWILLAAAALTAIVRFSGLHTSKEEPLPVRVSSLAVLPLENLSEDVDQEYFADGMTDALITELARLEDLDVISRTSVMPYKKTRMTVPQIAAELGVDAVVEGTVTRSGEGSGDCTAGRCRRPPHLGRELRIPHA